MRPHANEEIEELGGTVARSSREIVAEKPPSAPASPGCY